MSKIFAVTFLASAALSNNVPIYGNYPGWVTGEGRTGITVEIFVDLMCSACQHYNPIWNEVLQTPWLDGTVSDQVNWAYTPFPLPYHVHTFQVTQIVPYLQYLCATDPNQCGTLSAYKDYCYTQLDYVLSETDTSQDAFVKQWSA